MNYEGTTYRPPPEADSLLLQVTVGCAHNQCTFCNMYRDVSFRRISMDRIEADLAEARGIFPRAQRIFLVNGDAFVLKADRLAAIAKRIRAVFSECRTIAMYASVRNIRTKTDKELEMLRRCGINDLYLGIESGWDAVLARINKGHTVEEAGLQLGRLRRAGIDYMANLMLGVAGRGRGLENARRTARFLSQTGPKLIWVGTLAIFEGTQLHRDVVQGRFTPAPEREILEEEKALIQGIDLNDVPLWANHPTNSVRLFGRLRQDREELVATINAAMDNFGDVRLDRVLTRNTL